MSLDINTVQDGRLCNSRVPLAVSASKDDEVGGVDSESLLSWMWNYAVNLVWEVVVFLFE